MNEVTKWEEVIIILIVSIMMLKKISASSRFSMSLKVITRNAAQGHKKTQTKIDRARISKLSISEKMRCAEHAIVCAML